jgi:competence protein ComEA
MPIPNFQFLILNFLIFAVFSSFGAVQSPPRSVSRVLPEAPGKDVFESVCSLCHSPTAVLGKQWTRTLWDEKVREMLQEETDVTAPERAAIVEYLSANFRPGGTIYVNKAKARDLETALDLSAAAAAAFVRYREENGSFKTLDDLKKVPGLDAATIDARKDRFDFYQDE